MPPFAEHSIAGWFTGSLYRIETRIFFILWWITSRICVHMSCECWTTQGSISCNLCVCHDWTATDATNSCMPACGSILAFAASWFISVCGFCLCGIRRWKFQIWSFIGMKGRLNLLPRHLVGRKRPIPWPGKSCDFTPLDSTGALISLKPDQEGNKLIFLLEWCELQGKKLDASPCFDVVEIAPVTDMLLGLFPSWSG